MGKGSVITIDIEIFQKHPIHPRIKYFVGSSTDRSTHDIIKKLIKPEDTIMVILDSEHSPKHVAKEIEIYSKYVTPGSYLIVEDTNIGGNPIILGKNGGPMTAVKKFLKKNRNFVADTEWERFRVTSCPNGFLRRIDETNNRDTMPS